MTPEKNVAFLQQCARLIPLINFVDHRTGFVFAQLKQGQWSWRDEPHIARVLVDRDAKAGFEAIGSNDYDPDSAATMDPPQLDRDEVHTLGVWGKEVE